MSRFLQTDPIGYADQMNLYAYVHGDPLNGVDPMGKECVAASEITVTCDTVDETVYWVRDNLPTGTEGRDRREYGGCILENKTTDRNGNEKLSYTTTIKAGERQVAPLLLADQPDNAVAAWHSHPKEIQGPDGQWESSGFGGEMFSDSTAYIYNRGSKETFGVSREYSAYIGDIDFAERSGVPLYLITPSNKIKKADHKDMIIMMNIYN